MKTLATAFLWLHVAAAGSALPQRRRIEPLTSADVSRAVKQHLKPEKPNGRFESLMANEKPPGPALGGPGPGLVSRGVRRRRRHLLARSVVRPLHPLLRGARA
jgi:hypothetical protein